MPLDLARREHLKIEPLNGVQEEQPGAGALIPIEEPFAVIAADSIEIGPRTEEHRDLDAAPLEIE
jgi:hypothetical protein